MSCDLIFTNWNWTSVLTNYFKNELQTEDLTENFPLKQFEPEPKCIYQSREFWSGAKADENTLWPN